MVNPNRTPAQYMADIDDMRAALLELLPKYPAIMECEEPDQLYDIIKNFTWGAHFFGRPPTYAQKITALREARRIWRLND